MTDQEQAVDSAGLAADAASQTVSREELTEAISRRQSALDRARTAETRLAELETAQADRQRAELESQGRFKELAEEANAKSAALMAKMETSSAQLAKLTDRHRKAVDARFQALPTEVQTHLAGRLGEEPSLDAFDDAVSLAESFNGQSNQGPSPRTLGGQPSAGKVAGVTGSGKATADEVSRMTQGQMAEYLKRFY